MVLIDGKMMVIEYSDLPQELAARSDSDGNAVFWAGSIAVHVFNVDFLNRSASNSDSLPFHRAHKKVAFRGRAGKHGRAQLAQCGQIREVHL